jgi:hypothetical protein
MRSRFALLLAAAVVVAPGWYGQQTPVQRESGVAARVLSPTVDGGAVREAAADLKQQLGDRQARRWRPGITFGIVDSLSLGAMALLTFWIVGSYSRALLGVYRLHFRLSRAPPRLQHA